MHFWEFAIECPVDQYELSNIYNLDEILIPFEYLNGKTYDVTGGKTDKCQPTLVLGIFTDGIVRVPPMVIFYGTGQRLRSEKEKYHMGVLVEYNSTAYMNDTLFECYITSHLIPILGSQPTPFALDLMGSHKTLAILDILRQNDITPSLIPSGCTSLVQPLDISVNKPFKEMLCDLTDQKIFELESMEAFERWTVGDCCIMTTQCIGNAFHQFHTHKAEIICFSFCNVGLSLPIDGSLDYKIDIKGFENLQIRV
ncbi:hypothetical protein L873DRAFT_1719961 [Choiromyces venosus 120613-1]|uniref:DDE-1 domain-containing protein n=1 Tax=Choiromyces venosus 120613-1 TaxID=1336337 RepID=A0A3N4J7V8_9PEZI|nr:hypothetical protein L873DRAFT_1719961 [Choiromyces venosus 120613-1]